MTSWEFDHFNKVLQRIEQMLLDIKLQGEKNMAQIDDLNTALENVQTALDGVTATLAQATADANKSFADLAAEIKSLQAGNSTPTDLTAPLASAATALTKLTAISTALSALDAEEVANDPTAVPPVVTPPAAS